MAISNTSRTRNFGAGSPAGASVAAYGPYWNAELDLLYANDVELQNLIDSITVTADNSVQLTGAQSVAGAKTWEDAAVFESTMQVGGAATYQSTGAFTGKITANGGLEIATGQTIDHNGNPVAGYLEDGTPYYKKYLTGTISAGSTTANLAHSLGSVYTNSKIRGLMVWVDSGSFYEFPASSASSTVVYYSIDNTNVTIERGGTTGNKDCFAIVDYIL